MARSRCWFRAHGLAGDDCQGRLQHVHLISKQLLKRELKLTGFALWPQELIVMGCYRHHARLDIERKLRIARPQLPASVEEWLDGLDGRGFSEQGVRAVRYWADREYGQRTEEHGGVADDSH